MLVLSRRPGEVITIGDEIRVEIVEVRGDSAFVGVHAPRDVPVQREEVIEALRRADEATREREGQRGLQRAEPVTGRPDPAQQRLHVAPPPVSIRRAREADLPAINRIYNHYVHDSTCTYQEEPSTAEERAAWFAAHDAQHPVTVAERDGEVVGWGSLSKFHPRSAYARTVENSVYVRHDCRRQRVGEMLLGDLLERAARLGHRTVIAGIDTEQHGSVALHEKFGFAECGRLREVGFKFGRWLDVVYLQRML